MTILPIHPAALLMPACSEEEQTELTEDIGEHGLMNPLIVFDGHILDGRSRQQSLEDLACHDIHIEPRYEQYTGSDPYGYVISHNVARRSLNFTQRVCIGVEYWSLVESGAVQFKRPNGIKMRDAIGAKFQVAGVYIDQARRIKAESENLYDAMREGGLSVYSAYDEVKGLTSKPKPPKMVRCPHCGQEFDSREVTE